MSGELSGRVVILTGAAGGQGRITARLLIEAGASVVLTDRDPSGAALADELGASALFLPHDITDPEAWTGIVSAAVARFGGLDGLVNNAAIAGRDSLDSLSPDRLRAYLDVNVLGALNGVRAVLPALRARGGGSIVNIASISALRATPGLVGYGVSKWALRGLTRNAAAELASQQIRVNLVLPGAVEVSMIKDAAAAPAKSAVADQVPMGRVARCEEIARTTVFLLSEAASYTTGAELVVDGGWCA
jgi:3alpha(or 20beta)-hydroxysteroid dehydrogenase